MAESGLLTLSEVSKRTGISMPTLQRYKKEYQSRIPSEGKGRKQRYPESALPVFEELKRENIARRGRPRKGAAGKRKPRAKAAGSKRGAGPGRKPAAGARGAGRPKGLLTLTEIGKRTGISYPTLTRYVKLHLRAIPHEGTGRSRRYHSQAVEVFSKLRAQSGRGRKPGGGRRAAGGGRPAAAAAGGDGRLAQRVRSLEKAVNELTRLVGRPIKVTLSR